MQIDAQFPEKLKPLFDKARYKVLYSGRNAAKSWSVARALLLIGANRRIRVLCTRETQKSIRDSVHKLLSDQIERLSLTHEYEIQQAIINGRNGTEFVFTGLSDQTADSIKSYEGVDYCWVEEAQSVSDRSWNILTKTIRRDDSEIWITFNPELDTDPTWVRFVENPYPGSIVIQLNYRDNPWFSATQEQERIRDEKLLPKIDYDHIWEGKCRPAVAGAIYADEVSAMFAQNRVGLFPYDPRLPVYAIFDLGWNDAMSIGIVQRQASSTRFIDYIEDDHKTLAWYSQQLRLKDYPILEIFLPHDGANGDWKTGESSQQILEGLKWRVSVLPKKDPEEGIREVRMAFPGFFINQPCCGRLLECLKRYRRVVSKTTGTGGAPQHDEFSHAADMVRYAIQAAPQMDTSVGGPGLKLPPLKYGWSFK